MWGSDWLLAARILDAPFGNWFLVKRDTVIKRAWVYAVHANAVPDFVASSILIPQGQHFPFGADVAPD